VFYWLPNIWTGISLEEIIMHERALLVFTISAKDDDNVDNDTDDIKFAADDNN